MSNEIFKFYKPCPNAEIRPEEHKEDIIFEHEYVAQAPHTCPFAVDIHDDFESLCECCKECTIQCALEI